MAKSVLYAELLATGAVVVGRKTFDYAGHWGGDHHGVPIFVPHTQHPAGAARRLGPLPARDRDAQGQRRPRVLDAPGVTHLRYQVTS
jgi:hypothetical protein